jgi:hypothetical protein
MIRISVTADHTRRQLNWALKRLEETGRKFGLIS